MGNYKRNILAAVCIFVLPGLLMGSVPESTGSGGLQFSATWAAGIAANQVHEYMQSGDIEVFVRLHNSGPRSLVVLAPVKRLIVVNMSKTNRILLVLKIAYNRLAGGDVNVPSANDLRPIDLYPGESTEWHCGATLPRGTDLTSVDISYEVDDDIGSRFRAWHGEIERQVEFQTAGR